MPHEPSFPIAILFFGASLVLCALTFLWGYFEGKEAVWRIVGKDAADLRFRLFTGRGMR